MKVYVAGPYTAIDGREETRLDNVRRASEVAQRLLKAGHAPFCPHTMTAGWEETCGYDDFLRLGLEWLATCDAILLLPGWEQSRGARREQEEAVTLGLLTSVAKTCWHRNPPPRPKPRCFDARMFSSTCDLLQKRRNSEVSFMNSI